MPWTGEEFRSRHAKHLSKAQAAHAASMANAMLERGVPEGTSIATAIARAKRKTKEAEPQPFGSLAP